MHEKWKQLITLPFRISRGVYLCWAGVGLLALAVCCTRWVASYASSIDPQTGGLVLDHPVGATESIYRLGYAFAVGGLLFMLLLNRSPGRISRLSAIFLMALLLTLPKAVQHLEPRRVALETILFTEQQRVIVDMEMNVDQQQVSWRDYQTFSEKTAGANFIPEQRYRGHGLSFFVAPQDWDSYLRYWMGFGQAYLTMLPWGPVLAMGALICLAMGLYLRAPKPACAVGGDLLPALLIISAVLFPQVAAQVRGDRLMNRAMLAAQGGDYAASIRLFEKATCWLPSLKYNINRISFYGRLYELIGQNEHAYAIMHRAFEDVRSGDAAGCVARFERLILNQPRDPAVRLLYAAALNEAGRWAFDAGQSSLAEEYWERSLGVNAANPTGWYGLALINFRHRNFERAAFFANQLPLMQHQPFAFRTLTVQSQAYVASAWFEFNRDQLRMAHEYHSASLNPEGW